MNRHLIAVWNPSYAADALEEHQRILLDLTERHARKEIDHEDVYVLWARLRSTNRFGALPHLREVLDMKEQTDRMVETHLYLTDYRSLYVGLVGDISDSTLLQKFPGEAEHLPAYSHNLPADLYFELHDIRRLVADDTVAVSQELAKLRNVRYEGRPVSLYGGMVDLPLIVERPDARLWFSDDGKLTEGKLWVEHDAALRSETDRMSRELRENLFGDEIWAALEPGTRTFLASGEAVWRARRSDLAFDFSAPAVSYAKAIETELNALLFAALARVYSQGNPIGRHTNVDGRTLDLGAPVPHQTLGVLVILLQHNEEVRRGIKLSFSAQDQQVLLAQLPHALRRVAELRNPAAHSGSVDRDEAANLRTTIVGIGQEGLVTRLARIKLRTRTPDRG